MIRISISLPAKRRLDLTLVKDRKREDETPLLPNLGKVLRIKKGNKFSRFFRHIFENEKIRKMVGANFAIMIFASSVVTTQDINAFSGAEETNVTSPIVFTTETAVRIPLDNKIITQGFKFYHPGIDFDGVTGDPVYPIVDGIVEQIQYTNYAYGNAILVNHDNDINSLYAHLSDIFVLPGESVKTNEAIGTVGATGRAFGDHLHFEVRVNGNPINPLTILP